MLSSSKILYSKGNNDDCYTPKYGVSPLLEFMTPFKDKTVWCPFDDNESNFVKLLKTNGYNVIHSHIDEGKDYYEYEPEKWDVMVSNPPLLTKEKYLNEH